MSIVETDWGAFLAPDSDIRPDVIFRVEGASDEGQTHVKNIAAHRMFLAGVSFHGHVLRTFEGDTRDCRCKGHLPGGL